MRTPHQGPKAGWPRNLGLFVCFKHVCIDFLLLFLEGKGGGGGGGERNKDGLPPARTHPAWGWWACALTRNPTIQPARSPEEDAPPGSSSGGARAHPELHRALQVFLGRRRVRTAALKA